MSAESLGELYVNLTARDGGLNAMVTASTAVVQKMEGAVAELGATVAKAEAPLEAAGDAVQQVGQQAATMAPKAEKAAGAVAEVGRSSEKATSGLRGLVDRGLRALNDPGTFQAVIQFAKEAVQAFLEAEKASMRLEMAVQRAGSAMPGLAGRLSEAADAMERATGVDGDYIKSMQQLALQLQVAPGLVERTTRAALDFAEATGANAKSAMLLLTTATEGNLDQLAKWGVKVSESEVQARGLTAVLEKFEAVYGGATSQLHEGAKALALNAAAWGDLKEAVGGFLTRLGQATGASSATAKWMDAMTEFISAKTALANVDEAKRIAQLNHLRDVEAAFIDAVRLSEEQLAAARRRGSADEISDAYKTLSIYREQLAAATRARRESLGFSGAPTMRLPSMDLSGAQKAVEEQQRAVKEAVEQAAQRLEQAFAKMAELANSVDARQADVASAAEEAAIKSAMGVEAAELQANAFIEDMNKEMAEADAALAQATFAADARRAAESAKQMQTDAQSASSAGINAVAAVKDSLINRALGSLGQLGGIISNAAQAAAAGPIGVIASVLLDLLSKSATFQRIVEILNGVVQTVADALGQVLEPLVPLAGALGVLAEAVVPLAATILKLAVDVIAPLTPVLVLVAKIVEGLMPVLTVLVQAFIMVMNPLMALAGPVLKGLFTVLKGVGIAVLTIAKAIGDAWNFIIGGVQKLLRSLDDIPLVGGKLGDLADSLEGAKANTDAMGEALKNLKNLDWDSALDTATDAAERFKKATEKANEQLDNVPQVWKRMLRTRQAEDRQAPPAEGGWGQAPGTGGSPGRPPPGTGAGVPPALGGEIGAVGGVAGRIRNPGAIGGAVGRVGAIVGGAITNITNVVISGVEQARVVEELRRFGLTSQQKQQYAQSGSVGSSMPLRFAPEGV